MAHKTKHIILTRLLLFVLIVPPFWQLEHTFNNSHGVLYHQNADTIHSVYDNSCAPLHKHFQFHSVYNVFFFQTLELKSSVKKNSLLPQKPYIFSLRTFVLRAPPKSA